MVTKAIIKDYGFNTLEDYFDYITESSINGQHKQVRELFDLLSNKQKGHFFSYLYDYEAIDTEMGQKLKNYFLWLS